MPVKAAGWRIEPPVSVPVDARRDARRDRRRRPARRSARSQRGIAAVAAPPRRDHRPVGAGLVRRAHGELVHVELAEHPRARALRRLRGDGAFVGRLEALEDVAAGGRVRPLGREQILDAQRNARERRQVAAASRLVGGIGGRQRILRRLDRVGVEQPAPRATAALILPRQSRARVNSPRSGTRREARRSSW